jgi:choline dehydrogenase-like flavoprotein
MSQGYDFVIVGGGSAGCVMAARLTEDPSARVLLLEAGGKDSNPYIHMPVGFAKMTSGPFTWGLKTAPQRHACNREIPYAQARVIGGGSSINAEIFTRGNPADYDRWAQTFNSIFYAQKATLFCQVNGMGQMAPLAYPIYQTLCL